MRNGKLAAAETVHHKRKMSDGGTNDWDNLQALCSSCHSSLHAGQGDYF
jgi:5-methylcytosine-specific restriction protein A